jgi:crotonobetainyl-CoA:carnitine CoA-transferase CaiB-like acyl-CoA transferase
MANLTELVDLLQAKFAEKSSAEWLALFEGIGLPAGPVLTVAEMHADPHVLARDMVVTLEHPKAGTTKAIGMPVKFSGTPGGIRRPAPTFGQHTREVLAAAGLDEARIDAMVARGAAIDSDNR